MISRRGFLLGAAALAGGAAAGAAAPAEEGATPPAARRRAWRPFSNKSPFNTPIPPEAPVHPNSAAIIRNLCGDAVPARTRLWVNIERWSIPVHNVPEEGAVVRTVRCDRKAYSGFEEVTLPVWPGAVPDPLSDAHMVVLDRPNGCAWDFWGARWRDGQLQTKAANRVDLAGDGLVPEGGCRLVGFALLAGLIRPEEIAAGRIDHALVFAYDNLDRSHVWPASRHAGRRCPPNSIPCGGLVQLDPELDIESLDLPPAGKMIARALQEYGMYMSDYAGGLAIYAENPLGRAEDPWPKLGLTTRSPANIPVERMRVIEPGATRRS